MCPRRSFSCLPALLAMLLLAPIARPQEKAPIAVYKLLQEDWELKKVQVPGIKMKEFLCLICDGFLAKGKELPILIDVAAFKKEDDDRFDPYEIELDLWNVPVKTMSTAMLLRIVLSQIPTDPPNDATLVLRNGVVEITTKKEASLPRLLQQKVLAGYRKRPLVEVLEDLGDRTGVTIALDPRVADKGQTKITVVLRNDITLGAAVRIVADMAGLQVVEMESGLYVTSPTNAQNLERLSKPPKKEAEKPAPPTTPRQPSSSAPSVLRPYTLHSIQQELLENRSPRDCPYPGTGVNPIFRDFPKIK